MTQTLMTTIEVARELALTPQTIYKWRKVGYGPPFVRVGRAVRYRRDDFDLWLQVQADGSKA